MRYVCRCGLLVLLLMTLFACVPPVPGPSLQAEEMSSPENPVDIGRRIYREGIQSDGTPVQALVMGDIPVSGDQFTCLQCHRYSGLGGPEGTKYVMSTSGPALFSPRIDLYHERPAYTDESLAEALRHGIDPGGNVLDSVMPVYDLSEEDMRALIAYLKTLSSVISPGVDEQELHIATVIGPSVPKKDREAMLAVLEMFLHDINAQSRRQKILAERGPFYLEYKNKAYREKVLHVWELKGAAETWGRQLEDFYRKQPVFAMVSGIAVGPWQPVHDFCERHQIPCILPNTDLPDPTADEDFYTLYFSEGLGLEVRTIFTDLKQKKVSRLVQVVFDEPRSRYAAAALHELNRGYPPMQLASVYVNDTRKLAKAIADLPEADALVIWAPVDVLQGLKIPFDAVPIYLSSTLLSRVLSAVPEGMSANVAHPFNLPGDQELRESRATAWINSKKIPLQNPRVQTQTWFACKVFNSGLTHIKRNFYRDYFLEVLDHSNRLGAYSGNYPRLSFGPNQRYLAKGAYLVSLAGGEGPGKIEARWVVP